MPVSHACHVGICVSYIENRQWQSEVAVVTDPDGTRLELVSMPGDPSLPVGQPVLQGHA